MYLLLQQFYFRQNITTLNTNMTFWLTTTICQTYWPATWNISGNVL